MHQLVKVIFSFHVSMICLITFIMTYMLIQWTIALDMCDESFTTQQCINKHWLVNIQTFSASSTYSHKHFNFSYEFSHFWTLLSSFTYFVPTKTTTTKFLNFSHFLRQYISKMRKTEGLGRTRNKQIIRG